MAEAKSGDKIKAHYTGKLEDGTEFDSSAGRDPLEFTIGEGNVISGFEQAFVGMNPGDRKTVTIDSGEAYGPYRDDMVAEVAKDQLPPDLEPKVGDRLEMSQGAQKMVVVVKGVSDESITIDANHPLAGKNLVFDIELVEIVM